MTPVEKLEAAIERLEAQRDTATEGPWRVRKDGILVILDAPADDYPVANSGELRWGDAFLIETLHRTVDAQLEILRRGLRMVRASFEAEPGWCMQYPPRPEVVDLADAILGGEQS